MKIYFLVIFLFLIKLTFSQDHTNKYDFVMHIGIKYFEQEYDIWMSEYHIDTIVVSKNHHYYNNLLSSDSSNSVVNLVNFIYKRRNFLFLFKQNESHVISLASTIEQEKCDKDSCFVVLFNKIGNRKGINGYKRSNRYANLVTSNRQQTYFRYCFINWPWKIPTSVKLYKLYEKALKELKSIKDEEWKKDNSP